MELTEQNYIANGSASPAESVLAWADAFGLPGEDAGDAQWVCASPTGEPWPEPEPLGGKLPEVARMLPEMLPAALRPMVEDIAERMQAPLDFPAVAAVATLAGMVGRRALIQPKERDTGWCVIPNLWGGIVAEPGSMKSPILATVTAPAKELEREWFAEHEEAMKGYAVEAEAAELAKSAWKEASRKNYGKGDVPQRPANAPAPPKRKRLLTTDATFESLQATMADNPGGLFVYRDELAGWLAGLERQGREQERAFYLEAWNGDQPYTVDRVGRGSVRVEHTCVSLFGGIQPSRLRGYLADALRGGPANDGLMQRFQLLVWPDPVSGTWEYMDRQPNEAAFQQAATIYRKLARMDPENPVRFRFSPDAQELFIAWLTELENRRLRRPEIGDAMRAHLAKYRSLMPSLSLLLALADGATGTVSLAHAQQAASWCEYLESHAERVYVSQAPPERRAARLLGQKLASGHFGKEQLAVRDVYRKCWSGLAKPEEARAALQTLAELGWVRPLPGSESKVGRLKESYAINPLLEAHHAEC